MKQKNIKKAAALFMLVSFIFGTAMPALATPVLENGQNSGGSSTGVIIYNNNLSTTGGDAPKAGGVNSTAMGIGTNAGGNYSTAMGSGTTSNGDYSTAMGGFTEAIGYASTSMGYSTTASGNMSTSIGNYAVASGSGSFAGGGCVEYNPIASGYDGPVGGQAYGKSSFAFGVLAVAGDAGDSSKGINAISMGYQTTASGNYSFAGGKDSRAVGNVSFAFGDRALSGSGNALVVNNTIAMGSLTAAAVTSFYGLKAKEVFNGMDIPAPGGGLTLGSRLNSYLGMAQTSGYISDVAAEKAAISAMDDDAAGARLADIINSVGGLPSLDTLMEMYNVLLPYGTTASGEAAIAIGNSLSANGTVASATNSMALGNDAKATGINSLAVGFRANASNQGAVSIGESNAGGFNSMAFGNKARAEGDYSTAIGRGASTTSAGTDSTAIGTDTQAVGVGSTAIGYRTTSEGDYSTAMGYATIAYDYSTAMGYQTHAAGELSTAMGNNTVAKGKNSTSMGNNTTAGGDYSTSMGYGTGAAGNYSTSMGSGTKAKGIYSTSTGYKSVANGAASFAGGGLVVGNGSSTSVVGGGTAYGDGSFAFGAGTVAGDASGKGKGSVAMGTFAQAVNDNTFALGWADPFKDEDTAISYMIAGMKDIVLNKGKHPDLYATWEGLLNILPPGTIPGITSVDDLANITKEQAEIVAAICKQFVLGIPTMTNAELLAASLGKYLPAISGTTASGENAIAIGASTTPQGTIASGNNSIALGTDAKAAHDNSVALGSYSVTAGANEISVGGGVIDESTGAKMTRKITNVAKGTVADGSTDAVTGGQLYNYSTVKIGTHNINSGNGIELVQGDNIGFVVVGNKIMISATGGGSGGGDWDEGRVSALETVINNITTGSGEIKTQTVETNTVTVGGVKITGDKIDAGGTQITNVKAVKKAEGGTNAATTGQLYAETHVENGNYIKEDRVLAGNVQELDTIIGKLGMTEINILKGETVAADLKNLETAIDNIKVGETDIAKGHKNETTDVAAKAEADGATAVGYNTVAEKEGATAVGYGNKAVGKYSTAVGYKNEVSGERSGAFGDPNKIDANYSYAVGNDNKILTSEITNNKDGSFVLGNENEVTGKGTFVLGNGVTTSANNSVILGNGSTATEDNVVSVGSADNKRRIVNVDKAVADTDAVNYVQMREYVAEHGGSDPAIRQELNAVAGEVKEVGAISAALAGLRFAEPSGEEGDKFVGAVAYGNYRGESAGAIGIAYKPSPNFMLSASTSVGQNYNAYNAGASLKFGKGETAKTRAELQKQVKYLNGEIETLKKENRRIEALEKENAEIKEMLNKLLKK